MSSDEAPRGSTQPDASLTAASGAASTPTLHRRLEGADKITDGMERATPTQARYPTLTSLEGGRRRGNSRGRRKQVSTTVRGTVFIAEILCTGPCELALDLPNNGENGGWEKNRDWPWGEKEAANDRLSCGLSRTLSNRPLPFCDHHQLQCTLTHECRRRSLRHVCGVPN